MRKYKDLSYQEQMTVDYIYDEIMHGITLEDSGYELYLDNISEKNMNALIAERHEQLI